MTVVPGEEGEIRLEGDVGAGEAEALLRLVLERPDAAIDWRACRSCHTAVLQVLMAANKPMLGPPAGLWWI